MNVRFCFDPRVRWLRGCALLLAAVGVVRSSDADANGPPPDVASAAEDRFDSVVIDPGHGGDDLGALGPGGVREKDVVLTVARRIADGLRRAGLRVVLTREDDRAVGLAERAESANQAGGDLFLSIHANAASSERARGVETYFASLEASDAAAGGVATRENASFVSVSAAPAAVEDPLLGLLGELIDSEHRAASDEFARLAEARLAALDDAPSRGVKQAPFAVLLHVSMPASLVEIGFVTNRADAAALDSEARQSQIADALISAVLEFRRRFDVRRGIRRADANAEVAVPIPEMSVHGGPPR